MKNLAADFSSIQTPEAFTRNSEGGNMKSFHRSSRRAIIKAGGAVLASTALPRIALPQDKPAIGTFPAGSSGSEVTIGAAVPRTGTYAVQGEDELKGWQLAVEHIN